MHGDAVGGTSLILLERRLLLLCVLIYEYIGLWPDEVPAVLRGRIGHEGVELVVIDKWVVSAIIDGVLLWALRLLRLRAVLVVSSVLLCIGLTELLSEGRELSLELVDFTPFFLLDLLVSDVSLQFL